MENHTDLSLTLTVEEAARLLGIGRSTAYELVHTGDIPSLRLGRRIVVPRTRLAELLGSSKTDDIAGPEQVRDHHAPEEPAPLAGETPTSPTLF
jgi:excisionase family DNA binding protein